MQAHIYHCTEYGRNRGSFDNAVDFSKWTVFGNSYNTVTPLNDTPIILLFFVKCCSKILKFGTVIEGHLSNIFMLFL